MKILPILLLFLIIPVAHASVFSLVKGESEYSGTDLVSVMDVSRDCSCLISAGGEQKWLAQGSTGSYGNLDITAYKVDPFTKSCTLYIQSTGGICTTSACGQHSDSLSHSDAHLTSPYDSAYGYTRSANAYPVYSYGYVSSAYPPGYDYRPYTYDLRYPHVDPRYDPIESSYGGNYRVYDNTGYTGSGYVSESQDSGILIQVGGPGNNVLRIGDALQISRIPPSYNAYDSSGIVVNQADYSPDPYYSAQDRGFIVVRN